MANLLNKEEFEQLVTFIISYYNENPAFFGDVDLSEAIPRLAEAVTSQPCFVVRKEGRLVGCLVLEEIPGFWFNKTPYLADMVVYVDPSERSFATARQLLKEADEYAKMVKKRLILSFCNPEDVDRKEILLKRIGFRKVGSIFEGGYLESR